MPVRPLKTEGHSQHGLRLHQLFALVLLPMAVLALVFALGGAYLHQQVMRRMVGERDALTIRAAANALQTELYHRQTAIQGLVLLVEESSTDPQNILDTSDYLQNNFDIGLAYTSADGTLMAFTGESTTWDALLDPGLAQLQTEGASLQLLDDKPILLVASPLPSKLSMVVGAFSLESLGRQVLSTVLPENTEARIFLVDTQGFIIFDSDLSGLSSDLLGHPGVTEALAGTNGTTYVIEDGEEHVVAYGPVPGTGWALIMEENWQSVVTPLSRTTEVAPLALVPVLLIALLGIWFGVRQIVLPLRQLETRAAALAQGNYHPIEEPIGGIAEIRHLKAELGAMARKVQVAQESLHDYIGAITNAQEDERRRLARELHDDTLQALIALKQRIQLEQSHEGDGEARASLLELEALAEQTIQDLRRLTRDLRPIYLEDLGMVTALEVLARETGAAASIPVQFCCEGEERRLSPQVELSLYRIAQEALNNVVRHAQASKASLLIQFLDGSLCLEVNDDGKGFDASQNPTAFAAAGHFGLLGLHERAELIKADLEIVSAPGQGTRLTVRLPNNPNT